jgi:lysozyme
MMGKCKLPQLLLKGKTMTISEEGKSLIKKFEGCELTAYKCAAGVPTIGYGHIKGVNMGDTITQEEANEMFNHEMKEYETYVNTAVTVPLSQNQFDAIVSWVFNLGNGNLQASTMLKVINSGDHAGVPAQIKRWNKAGGKVLDGLVRRREAEALLYQGAIWEHV